jgi:deoxyribodipyrimidine photo-lyase
MPHYSSSVCWFRRDLRLHDNAALYRALKHSKAVHCVFVFDTDILDKLTDKQDRRVEFIWHSLQELQENLHPLGSSLHVLHGRAQELIPRVALQFNAQAVFCNHDYEPLAVERDAQVEEALGQSDIKFHHCKDQVIFEKSEILTGAATPYGIFTPYKNSWLKKVDGFFLRPYPNEKYFAALAPCLPQTMPSLASLGFAQTDLKTLSPTTGESGADVLFENFIGRIAHYHETRDFPALNGGSGLSLHLRFGTISIRRLAAHAFYAGNAGAQVWLSELIWRDFYQMLMHHHPRLGDDQTFKPQFNAIPFTNNAGDYLAWCEGRTGFPLVDAAMRQLNQTGTMHNRLRMVTASFLVKDLHIDWRWGEHYFAQKLLDFDLASNNGGWQWAASTGCDAQPWFRIFNPVTQSEKFDAKGKFIRGFVPELTHCADKWIHAPWLMPTVEQQRCGVVIGSGYPAPIVNHAAARIKTLELFQQANQVWAG